MTVNISSFSNKEKSTMRNKRTTFIYLSQQNHMLLPLFSEASSTFLLFTEVLHFSVSKTHLIAINTHGAISLVVPCTGTVRAVHGDLGVVGTQTVTVSVVVRKEATLQHFVRGSLNTRHHVGRRERNLLHLVC